MRNKILANKRLMFKDLSNLLKSGLPNNSEDNIESDNKRNKVRPAFRESYFPVGWSLLSKIAAKSISEIYLAAVRSYLQHPGRAS